MGVGKVMPDITMCTNSNCRLRKHCYRYRAIPADYQSWGTFDCRIGHFIPITADDRLRSMDEIEGGSMDEIEGGRTEFSTYQAQDHGEGKIENLDPHSYPWGNARG